MSPKHIPGVFLVLILFVNLGASAARGDVAPRVASPGASVNSPFPPGVGLKGLQVQMIDDALKLGIKHAALNVSLTALIDLDAHPDSFRWKSGGRTFYFSRGAVEGIPVLPLSTAGVRVYLILLSTVTSEPRLNRIVRPAAAREVPNGITGFNVTDPEGRRCFEACVEFLADRFSQQNGRFGRVAGYIVGNEVNSHGEWYCLGPAKTAQVAAEYLRAVRIAHTAVRRSSSDARVYISLEHNWTSRNNADPLKACPGRELLDEMNRLSKAEGDFNWHIAFHPYPENLRDPRTWRDKSALPRADSPKITFKNLEQLTRYLRRPELLCQGEPRHVILSEQGFDTPDKPDGQAVQAAGFCYAWIKVARTPGIDAFILHRHVDNAQEGGLNLGLWTHQPGSIATPGEKKQIYEVFRAAGTTDWERAFRFALPIIGIKTWDEVTSGTDRP
ncbi:MAG TPA: DUF5722 domain-containing protein [Planctomycetaceae bacterium]|jgi:hypothetical protein|nr:DUF5722 domain-containing protein [Planctomycetaceae bacterium]